MSVYVPPDNTPLSSRIKLEVAGANYVIEDLDIDVSIKMTDQDKPNECSVTIWNLSDTSLSAINDKTVGIRVCFSKWNEEYKLAFEGNLRTLTKHRKKTQKSKKTRFNRPSITNQVSGADVGTTIVLNESYNDYMELHFSKSYKGEITTETIINDMIDSSGYPVSYIGELKHRTYKNSKVVHGPLRRVMFEILQELGATYTFQNGVIQILSRDAEKTNPVIVFTSRDVDTPEELDDLEIEFTTLISTQIRPNDWVQLQTRKFDDLYRVSKIEHEFDNYGKKLHSKITVTSKQVAETQNTQTDSETNTSDLQSTNLNTTAIGVKIAYTAESMYGGISESGHHCAKGVKRILSARGITYGTVGHAYQFTEAVNSNSSFNSAYSKVPNSQLPTTAAGVHALPKGAICVYDRTADQISGHIEIKTGTTSFISDFKQKARYNGWYKTWPSAVFLPKG